VPGSSFAHRAISAAAVFVSEGELASRRGHGVEPDTGNTGRFADMGVGNCFLAAIELY